MVSSRRWILLIPIYFSIGWIVFNTLFVFAQEAALTETGKELLQQRKGGFLLSNLLIFLPNLLLCFLLWTYIKTTSSSVKQLLILCFTSIGFGFLPQFFLSIVYYELWYQESAQLLVIIYGFPFVYLLGIMIGWVFGLTVVSIMSDTKEE